MATASTQYAPGLNTSQNVNAHAQPTKPAKHDVTADMMFFPLDRDEQVAPVHIGRPGTVIGPLTSLPVLVHDVSGEEDKYTLDTHGFQFVKHESKEKDFLDVEKIKAEYLPETEQLVKEVTGASRTFVFNHVLRRHVEAADRSLPGRGPAYNVHIDHSSADAPNQVRKHFPDEAEELLKKRYQIMNVWRPIKPILKDPLAVVDARSAADTDLVPVTMVYPHNRIEEKVICKPNPDHLWYFKYAQRPNEPLVFKNFDSVTDGRARRNPHSAFQDPAHENGYMRESIEVRVLAFFDK